MTYYDLYFYLGLAFAIGSFIFAVWRVIKRGYIDNFGVIGMTTLLGAGAFFMMLASSLKPKPPPPPTCPLCKQIIHEVH